MFRRELRVDVVKKQKDEDREITYKEFLAKINDKDQQEAIKSLTRFVGIQAVKWIAITTAITTAAKIAENRLSK